MRAFLLLTAVIFASIGIGIGALAAAGSDGSGPATLAARAPANADLQSVFDARDLQMSLSLAGEQGIPARARALVHNIRVVVDAHAMDSTTTLANAPTDGVAADVVLAYGSSTLVEIRVIGQTSEYVRANIAAIAKLPLLLGVKAQRELRAAQAVLGGRWFKIPTGALKKLLPEQPSAPLHAAAIRQQLETLTSGATFQESSAPAGGSVVVITGANRQVLQSLEHTLGSITGELGQAGLPLGNLANAHGSYVLRMTAAANNVVRQIALSDSEAPGLALMFGVQHQPQSITTPANVTPLPPGLLNALHLPKTLLG